MDEALIEFHQEVGGELPSNADQQRISEWVRRVIESRHGIPGPLNFILCGDDYLHRMNVEYLDHHTLTDIITFPMEDFPVVSGDLFISTERVGDNAEAHGEAYVDELDRVIIHGVLHLLGQGDKSAEEARQMRELEDWALGLR